jgi:hypothetical protein
MNVPPPPPGAHYRIACSAAERRIPCPGSLKMEEQFPQDDTEETLEGTAAHWVWETLRAGKPLPQYAPNGVEIDDTMIEGADLFNSAIDADCNHDPALMAQVQIETRLSGEHIHPQNGGTPDGWIYLPALKLILIWDYKYGFGYVNVVRNKQLVNYLACIVEKLRSQGHDLDDREIKVTFCIVQPRYYHYGGPVRRWSALLSDFRPDFNDMRNSYAEATGDNPRLISGSHCYHCTGRHACPAFNRSARAALDYVDRYEMELLDDASLGLELAIIEEGFERISRRYDALKADAEARMQQGRAIPGWGNTPTYGRRKWSCAKDEVFLLGDMMGVELRKPHEPITPTQALKLIDESVIKQYSETPKTGVKLVRVENSLAMRAFKKVT